MDSNRASKTDRPLRVIGLTGGIATGKSTVADYLARTYQLQVFDADVFAREAVRSPSSILERIRQRYGDTILQADGTLDRRELGRIVFDRPEERQWLEAQIHPFVRQRFLDAIAECRRENETTNNPKPIVLAIPLLFEAQMTDLVREIWVVACSRSQQQERLIQRDRLTPAEAIARIDSQMPTAQKCDLADLVLDNSSDPQIWIEQLKIALR